MSYKGIFSLGLKSAELQIATLFENVGGKKAVSLLDKLGNFSPEQQESLLGFFNDILDREIPKLNDEDSLFKDIDLEIIKETPFKSGKVLKLHNFRRSI